MAQLLPIAPRRAVSVRVATIEDLPFLDAMQKQHGRALGYFPTKQFQGYIEMGAVLVAESGSVGSRQYAVCSEGAASNASPLPTAYRLPPTHLGYVISRDRYLKRDELGVVYQLCVKSGDQRKLVGATLVREVFERSAYGCKLYCCWCAQDLAANHFWESMGFVPVAFRAGSTGKKRVHIFWQRRINADDASTPYWYPSMTNQGAIREDRLVFPIPPGTHWTEVKAVAIPSAGPKALDTEKREKTPTKRKASDAARGTQYPPTAAPLGGFRFQADEPVVKAKPTAAKPKLPKVKIDPQLVAKARELRDRYLEQVNDRLLIAPNGKYDVARQIAATRTAAPALPLLPAA